MAVLKRFFSPKILSSVRKGSEIFIIDKELSHFKASRVQNGESVILFDKSGNYGQAKVHNISSDHVKLEFLGNFLPECSSPYISLAVGMPKGNRGDWLIEKATEIGVSQIFPLQSDHSILKINENKISRWNRIIIQTSKQCLCDRIPVLGDSIALKDILEKEIKTYEMILWGCMPCDEDYKSNTAILSEIKADKKISRVLLVVGPEGDLSKTEKKLLTKNNGIPITLSNNRLRVETAAILMLGMAKQFFEKL